jgi:hypothetical protein
VAFSNIQPLIDTVIAAGKYAIVLSVTPLTAAAANYTVGRTTEAQNCNTLLAAYCAARPSTTLYVDTFSPLFNGTAGTASLYVIDGIHPNSKGSRLIGEAIATAATARLVTTDILPTSAADIGALPNFAGGRYTVGPWSTTPVTGGVPNGWGASASTGAPTATFAVVDPGDGKGYNWQVSITATAANDRYTMNMFGNSGATNATLGIVAASGQEIACAIEISWSNATAANATGLYLAALTNNSGGYGRVTAQDTTSEQGGLLLEDTGSMTLLTGRMKLTYAPQTVILSQVVATFSAASASALVVNIRRVTLLRV